MRRRKEMKERMKTNDPIQTEICNSTKKENCSKYEIYFYSFFRFEVITLFFSSGEFEFYFIFTRILLAIHVLYFFSQGDASGVK